MVAVTIDVTLSTVLCFVLIIISWHQILFSTKMLAVTPTHQELLQPQTYAQTQTQTAQTTQNKCLGLGIGGELDRLLSQHQHKHVILAMPAKAAGSSMKTFAARCSGNHNVPEHLLYRNRIVESGFLTLQQEFPSLIASHVSSDRDLQTLIRHASRNTLVVYVHREETSRIVSAINHVIEARVCPNGKGGTTTSSAGIPTNTMRKDIPCTVREDVLVDVIQRGTNEIGLGAPQILTCGTYDAIRDNASVLPRNLLFVDYKQASKLQAVLAKHYCPEQSDEEAIFHNALSSKRPVGVALTGSTGGTITSGDNDNDNDNGNTTVVSLEAWLDAKKDILEYALKTKQTASCQTKTRNMEEALLACPDEALHYPTFSV